MDLGMDPAERGIKFAHQLAERQGERGAAPDQHIVVARAQPGGPGGGSGTRRRCAGCRRQSHDLTQSASHAIALHGVAYLSRHGETDTGRPLIGAATRLHDEGAG